MSNLEHSMTMGSAIDFAKSTIAPRVFKTGPPNYYTQTAFPKRLDVTANFPIDDSGLAASTGEKIPTSTGIVIWQPNRGAGSIYRLGIVPQGASVTLGSRGFTDLPYLGVGAVLSFASQTAVPYNTTVTNDTLKVSPDLSQSFSQVRVYSGDLRIICDTVPIGNTALNGYFSAGAFSDTRDVSQVQEGANPYNCFDPSDLVQNSVTSKDGLKEVNVMKGIVALVGSDIQPFYTAPQTDSTDTLKAGWTTYNHTSFGSTMVTPAAGAAATFSSAWITPWNTTLTNDTNAAANGTACQSFNTGPININGCLDIDIACSLDYWSAANAAGCFGEWQIVISHVFVSCSGNTGVAGTAYACKYIVNSEYYFVGVGPNKFGGQCQTVFRTSPRLFQGGLTNPTSGGLYLGTYVKTVFQNTSTVASTANITAPIYITYQVRARSIYEVGELGPARVIRWDGLSNGQQVKVDGVVNVQCIPQGAVAPFVQSAAMYSDTAHNLNSMTFLAELYNGDSPFRRIWSGESYAEFMKMIFPALNAKTIEDWKQPKLLGVANSAGLFSGPMMTALGTGALGGLGMAGVGGLLSKMGLAAGKFGRTKLRRGRARSVASSHRSSKAGSKASSRRSGRKGRKASSHRRRRGARAAGAFGSGGEFGSAGEFGSGAEFGSAGEFGSQSYAASKYRRKGGRRSSVGRRRSGSKASSRRSSRASSRRSSRASSRRSKRSGSSRRSSRASLMSLLRRR